MSCTIRLLLVTGGSSLSVTKLGLEFIRLN